MEKFFSLTQSYLFLKNKWIKYNSKKKKKLDVQINCDVTQNWKTTQWQRLGWSDKNYLVFFVDEHNVIN